MECRLTFTFKIVQIIVFFADASEVERWDGYFRLKKDLNRISSFDNFINYLYQLQDTRFNKVQYKRNAQNLENSFTVRQRRAAGEEAKSEGIFHDTHNSHIDLEVLPQKFKLYLVCIYFFVLIFFGGHIHMSYFILGPLVPLFWISGGAYISSLLALSIRYPWIRYYLIHYASINIDCLIGFHSNLDATLL